ncbi:hypothetical protein MX629_00125 [Carnobacterium divergens]|uniref:Uncharacterized protein n=2 Tax=Carnobacterium divergens TaxID=2748 RepID=A0AAW8R564_CARDV|nr:hypothetical protein [Carnobacterium divergens]MDT1972795.1 hypothetical protein [Carnobacterium divergens]
MMHYLRIGTLLVGLFLYQDIVQPNFFISHFSNELFIDESITKNSKIRTSEESLVVENENQSILYISNQKEKLTESIQNKLVDFNKPLKIYTVKSKRTRVGKRMAILTGTMLYGEKSEVD